MANSEDIEARLCAYIEGEMDAAQTAEIERHLAAHPRHQKMIEDLIATRDLLAGLPRMRAPSDLSEGLQGQLERSMLLGDGLDGRQAESGWQTRLRRVPQLAAVTAVILLAAGLGSVVTYVLRAASHPAEMALVAPQASAAPIVDMPAATTQPAIVVDAPVNPPATMPVAPVVTAAEIVAVPDTQPSVISLDTGPTTQPVLAAADNNPTTMPTAAAMTSLVIPDTQPSAPDQLAGAANDPTTQPTADHPVVDSSQAIPAAVEQSPTAPATQPAVQSGPTTVPIADNPVGQ